MGLGKSEGEEDRAPRENAKKELFGIFRDGSGRTGGLKEEDPEGDGRCRRRGLHRGSLKRVSRVWGARRKGDLPTKKPLPFGGN